MRHVAPGPRRQPVRVAANKVIGEVARNWADSFPEPGPRALLLLRHHRWERRTRPCSSTPSAFFQQSGRFVLSRASTWAQERKPFCQSILISAQTSLSCPDTRVPYTGFWGLQTLLGVLAGRMKARSLRAAGSSRSERLCMLGSWKPLDKRQSRASREQVGRRTGSCLGLETVAEVAHQS